MRKKKPQILSSYFSNRVYHPLELPNLSFDSGTPGDIIPTWSNEAHQK